VVPAPCQIGGQPPAHAQVAVVIDDPAKDRPSGFMDYPRHSVDSIVILSFVP
jgi:hypothetical protein